MRRDQRLAPGEGFAEKLETLRLRIELLPAEHRPHLHDLADTIAAQHRRFEQRKSRTHDAD